ncbi:MAG: isocitrate/isopropylmalate dehydrogenase family protein [Planctomycetota bacterium]
MNTYKIAVVAGDGIGLEVIPEGIKVLNAAAKKNGFSLTFDDFPWSARHFAKTGEVWPDNALETLAPYRAIFLGAIGDPRLAPDEKTVSPILFGLRRGFDLYANVRPTVLLPGCKCPLANPGAIDMMIIRENTEGEYSHVGGSIYTGRPEEVVTQVSMFTRRGCHRIMKYAFEEARRRKARGLPGHVTNITKSNALKHGMVFWDKCFGEVAQQYPDIKTQMQYVDAASMFFVTKPAMFDTVVCSNLFGDILSDLGSALVGSLGTAASANLNPESKGPSMFEPVHGSAPDIAGKGLANPVAAILAGAFMLRFLGENKAADQVQAACGKVIAAGKTLTPDFGGSSKTAEVGDAVAALV